MAILAHPDPHLAKMRDDLHKFKEESAKVRS